MEKLKEKLADYKDEIHNALFVSNLSLFDWFKTFIASDEFGSLNAESKKLAFDQYENMKGIFEILNENIK